MDDVLCIFFGVPDGFSTTHQDYTQILFNYYQSSRNGSEFSVKLVGDRSFISYVNYDFLAQNGRPGSLFGICISIKNTIPIDFVHFKDYLKDIFDQISNKNVYFSRSNENEFHKYKINSIHELSKYVDAIQRQFYKTQLVENLVSFVPVTNKQTANSASLISYYESFPNILAALKKGDLVIFSTEIKPKFNNINDIVANHTNAQSDIKSNELQIKFDDIRRELVELVDRWTKHDDVDHFRKAATNPITQSNKIIKSPPPPPPPPPPPGKNNDKILNGVLYIVGIVAIFLIGFFSYIKWY